MITSALTGMMSQNSPWTLLSISGCIMWFDSDMGITLDVSNNVSAWADQSGNNNHVSQDTAGDRPAYITNVINGHSVVRSSPPKHMHVPAISCSTITAICVRLINTNTNSYPTVYSINIGSYRFIECYGTNAGGGTRISALNSTGYYASQYQTAPNTGVYEITTNVFDGVNRTQTSSWRYRLNGVEKTLGNGSALSSDGGATQGKLFSHPFSNVDGGFDGDIVALVVYSRNLSTAELRFVERMFGAKYGITVA